MDAFVELIKDVPALLIVIGAVFLLLAFGASVFKIEVVPFKARIAIGVIGGGLLALGIVLFMIPQPAPPTPTPQPTESPTDTPAPTVVPVPSPTAMMGFEIVALSTAVHAGDDATITIRTAPGAHCDLVYVTPSGAESTSDDLAAKDADDNGVCSWTWRIAAQTRPGAGVLTITVNGITESYAIVIK